MKKLSILTIALAALCLSSAARADYLTLGLGDWNALRDNDHSVWYGAQYRTNYFWNRLYGDFGVGGNNDGGLYGFAGLQYDINLIGRFYLIPGFGVGLYREGGSKDLGGPIEFKSSIEGAYEFDNGWRAGVSLWHISNAHIYDHNPGTETIEATVSIPFSAIMGR
jgi:hypothetical protein